MVQFLLQRSTRGLLLLVRLVIDVEHLPLARVVPDTLRLLQIGRVQ
jgi:hypothetical protein